MQIEPFMGPNHAKYLASSTAPEFTDAKNIAIQRINLKLGGICFIVLIQNLVYYATNINVIKYIKPPVI